MVLGIYACKAENTKRTVQVIAGSLLILSVATWWGMGFVLSQIESTWPISFVTYYEYPHIGFWTTLAAAIAFFILYKQPKMRVSTT